MLVMSRDRAVRVSGMWLGRDASRKECTIQMPPVSMGCTQCCVPARHMRDGRRVARLSLLLYLHVLQRGQTAPGWSLQERVVSALQLQERARQSLMGVGQSSSEKRLCQSGGRGEQDGGEALVMVMVNPMSFKPN